MARLTFAFPILAAALVSTTAHAAPFPGNQGRSWSDIARLPSLNGIYEASRENAPKDGQRDVLPVLTPKAAADQAAFQAKKIEDTEAANCLPPGMPRIMSWPYPVQVLLTPGEVTLVLEGDMQVRHIHTDGRDHPADPDLTFNGDSIGHWEGDTLVVDTVGLAPQAAIAQGVVHSKAEHIVERFRLADPNVLEVKTRVEDPAVLAKPWEFTARYNRHPDWTIAEYICEQNNRNSVAANGKAGINLDLKK
ncbi:MAG: hypothetical protein ACXU82_00225 [Caulobacteraceae bacterium]